MLLLHLLPSILPPHRDSRPASAGPHAGPLHLLERGSAGTFTYADFFTCLVGLMGLAGWATISVSDSVLVDDVGTWVLRT